MAVQSTIEATPPQRVIPLPPRVRGDRLASIGLRCSAFLLDYILTMLVPALTVLIAVYFKRRWNAPGFAGFVLIAGYLMTLVLVLLNCIYLCERDGQSFGKRFIGIRIVRQDGLPLTYKTTVIRHLIGYPLSVFSFGLGILWALWDPKQQGWHDKLAGTLVVKD
ncbi:MAG: RDD family protein [Acidobacteriota bacterium]